MGNSILKPVYSKWEFNQKVFKRLEMDVLLCSGLTQDYFKRINVSIGKFEEKNIEIHTIILSEKNTGKIDNSDQDPKEIIVLMHGFAGGSALFYPTFQDLVKRFDVILIDNIGMGGSSRPNDFD